MQPETQSKRILKRWHVVAAGVLIILIWLALGCFAYSLGHGEIDPGTFGDMFGAVNALFTGLAFAGVIITILLQRDELALQRDELQLTREELAGQREQLEAQSEGLRQQNFENTFFRLLDLLRQGANKIQFPGGGEVGPIFFRSVIGQVRGGALSEIDRVSMEAAKDPAWRHIKSSWIALGPYFSTVEELLRLLHAAPVPDKRTYARILSAQLSDDELSLLFFYALSNKGAETKPLVETYSMLRNLSPDAGGPEQAMRDLYDPKAFSED